MSKEKVDFKIGSEDEKFWTDLKKKADEEIIQGEREKEINTLIIEYAEKRIAQEQEKFK